jgi:hypothetical protein
MGYLLAEWEDRLAVRFDCASRQTEYKKAKIPPVAMDSWLSPGTPFAEFECRKSIVPAVEFPERAPRPCAQDAKLPSLPQAQTADSHPPPKNGKHQ